MPPQDVNSYTNTGTDYYWPQQSQPSTADMWAEILELRQEISNMKQAFFQLQTINRGPVGPKGERGEMGPIGHSGANSPEFKELQESVKDALDRVEELSKAVDELES
jgi:hypothetical protein